MVTGETWRLGRRPALDGLRGIAVLLVLICHFDMGQFTGAGGVGVTIFFTLSGFLITALLLEELERHGRIDLSAFYVRRAARLLPALVVVFVVVLALSAFVPTAHLGGGMVASVLTYSTNWYWIAAGSEQINALSHLWTLAIEEQFYFVWPLVVVAVGARWGRRGVLCVALLGAAASFGLRVALTVAGASAVRLDVGSDTRADSLLIGCALAAFMAGRRERESDGISAALALVLVFPLLVTSPITRGIPYLVPALAAFVLYRTAQGEPSRWLSWGPLVLLGRRSYGLYLWHFPVLVTLWPVIAPLGFWPRTVIGLSLSLALTAASWRWVEVPAMRWARSRRTALSCPHKRVVVRVNAGV